MATPSSTTSESNGISPTIAGTGTGTFGAVATSRWEATSGVPYEALCVLSDTSLRSTASSTCSHRDVVRRVVPLSLSRSNGARGWLCSCSWDCTLKIWDPHPPSYPHPSRDRCPHRDQHSNPHRDPHSDPHSDPHYDPHSGTSQVEDRTDHSDCQGQCLHTLTGHTGLVNWVIELTHPASWQKQTDSKQPIGTTVCSCSQDGTVRLWDAVTGQCTMIIQTGNNSGVRKVLELSNGMLITFCRESIMRMWDPNTGKCVKTLAGGHSDYVTDVIQLDFKGRVECDTVTKQGLYVCSCSYDASLQLWDVSNPELDEPIVSLIGHKSVVWGVFQLSDGRICSYSADKTLRLWVIAFDATVNGHSLGTMEGHSDSINCAVELKAGATNYTDNGLRTAVLIASCSDDRTVRVWNTNAMCCLRVLSGHRRVVRSVIELHNGLLCSCASDGVVALWSCQGLHVQIPSGLVPDNNALSHPPELSIPTYEKHITQSCLQTLEGHHGTVLGVIELDNGYICSHGDDNSIRLWALVGELNWQFRAAYIRLIEGYFDYRPELFEQDGQGCENAASDVADYLLDDFVTRDICCFLLKESGSL